MEAVVAFLSKPRRDAAMVQRYLKRIEDLRSACTRCTSSWSLAPGGSNGDPHKDYGMIALASFQDELKDLVQKQMDSEREVRHFLDKLADPRHAEVLWLKYVEGMTWDEVQTELERSGMPYSIRHIHTLHGNALQAVRKLWEEEEHDPT